MLRTHVPVGSPEAASMTLHPCPAARHTLSACTRARPPATAGHTHHLLFSYLFQGPPGPAGPEGRQGEKGAKVTCFGARP